MMNELISRVLECHMRENLQTTWRLRMGYCTKQSNRLICSQMEIGYSLIRNRMEVMKFWCRVREMSLRSFEIQPRFCFESANIQFPFDCKSDDYSTLYNTPFSISKSSTSFLSYDTQELLKPFFSHSVSLLVFYNSSIPQCLNRDA